MNSRTYSIGDLQDRLLNVEKQNRRFKQVAVAALVVPISLLVMGQAPSRKTVEANEFILRDNTGNVRAKLSMEGHTGVVTGNPSLVLFDEKGKQRVQLDGTPFTPGLSLYDSEGRRRANFSVVLDAGLLFLSDDRGNLKLRLKEGEVWSDQIETTRLKVLDTDGNTRAFLYVRPKATSPMTIPGIEKPVQVTVDSSALLAFYDEKEKLSGMLDDDSVKFIKSHIMLGSGILSLSDQTSSVLVTPLNVSLYDGQGFEATLGRTDLVTPRTGETQKTSAASLVMFNKNKNVIWKAP